MSIAVSPVLVEHSERLLLSAGSAPLHRLLDLDVQRELDVFVHESLHSFDDGIGPVALPVVHRRDSRVPRLRHQAVLVSLIPYVLGYAVRLVPPVSDDAVIVRP